MLYQPDPPLWPWGQSHELWNFTSKFLVKVFFSTFLSRKQLRQIAGQTSISLVTLNCGTCSEDQHDPYFMVQWFCLVSWRLFDVWTSFFKIMSQYDPMCDLKINVGHYDFALYLEDCMCMTIILQDYGSVWHNVWPQNKCVGGWIGRWCWVPSSAGASYYFGIW